MDQKSASRDSRQHRLDGWGFVGESFAPTAGLLAWLGERLGDVEPFPCLDPATRWPDAASLPSLGEAPCSSDPLRRLRHSQGRGFPDLVRLRSATVSRLPDAVVQPRDDDELAAILAAGQQHGLDLIPWGGGTSVTGGVNPPPGEAPVVTIDLTALSGLEELDATSDLATFGGGTRGPQIEAALAEHGFTLGHFPQSWELSTLGGWIATRSAGQESLGYGRIEGLVAGLDLVAPAGRVHLPTLPATAAGPDLRHLVLGSEGRFGVISRATVRIRPRPDYQRVEALLVPDWASGMAAARELVQGRVPLALLRVSDGPETEVAMTVGLQHSTFGPVIRGWLRLRGIGESSCLMLLGANGSHAQVDATFEAARNVLRPHGAVWLGKGPGGKWLADRFRHPYLRDGLFDVGFGTETLETAAPWSLLPELYDRVGEALREPLAPGEPATPVLCHISHPYRDGASLYFTFFFRCPSDPDEAIHRWARAKSRASDAIRDVGGTLSHHHGVGAWHAPWLPPETGELGHHALCRVARELDPRGVLNRRVLLDPSVRLED